VSGDYTILVAVAAGLVSFVSPCVLPLVPAYIGQLTAVAVAEQQRAGAMPGLRPSRWAALRHAVAYVGGFGLVFTLLGVTAAFAGGAIADYIRPIRVALSGADAIRPGRRGAGRKRWITSEISRAEVQRMRHASDVVLTGIGTVLADDPLLTDRTGLPRRRPLVRAVLDTRLRLPLKSKLVKTAAGDVLVVTRASENSSRAFALECADVEVLRITGSGGAKRARARPRAPGAGLPLEQVVEALGELEMLAVMIEAGPRLVSAALAAGVVDKAVLFYAPRFQGGDALPMLPVVNSASGGRRAGGRAVRVPELRDVTLRRFGPDFAVEGYLRDVYGDR
jgi:diaminohydroxyphosphoribosylaminopyrimidine deaminase/5-amino-6-(5-phosphoribosylamino)uracil reductase